MGFEKAHTLVLCFLYLPIPEFIAMWFFEGVGPACDILSTLMVIEVAVAVVVYVFAHNCPKCGKHVPQIRLRGNCRCHLCGYKIIE